MVKRLTPLVDGWNAQGFVDADTMGRSAAKVESIEEELHRLEEAVLEEQCCFGTYSKRMSRDRGCREEEDELSSFDARYGHPGSPAGILEGGIQHVAKEVEPERLRFHGKPTFNPVGLLDYGNRRSYERPLDEAKEIDPKDPMLPRVRVRCRTGGLLGVVEKLDEVGRLKLLPADRCRVGLENGLFAIPKDAGRDRMILDARRPNHCEVSESRWIYSMGTLQQLQHVFLEEKEDLYLHAEDLREFYHAFVIGEQRQERNILKAYFKPSAVSHLKAFTEGLAKEEFVGASLDTLAMGDTNAVAFGQTSHLSLLLRTGEFELEDFFGLRMRPSRKRWKAGLMIDDFLILEARGKDQDSSEVRDKVAAVRRAYEEVGLPRHDGKAVEGEAEGEFWGAQLDGRRGLLRPSLKRLVPLSHVILRVVALGRCTVGLLEVITGSAVSALQMRRRLLSVLHELYVAQRGRTRSTIVVLSKQAKDELLSIVGLLVVAVVDMRLQASEYLMTSDASTTKEAAAATRIPRECTAEFQRHTLQKGLWNRLLAPSRAYLRERGSLLETEELPEGDKAYEMHPLWEEVVSCCKFEQFGRVRTCKTRRHINIGEVRAGLAAEERLGRLAPDSYYVHLQDSQVSLACCVKGRSSSWSINRLLRQSIADHVGQNIRPFYGFVRSKLNPSDDPTRNKKVREPSRARAPWWKSIEEGDFSGLDNFLKERGMSLAEVAALPDPSELQADPELDGRTCKERRAERVEEFKQRKRKGGGRVGGSLCCREQVVPGDREDAEKAGDELEGDAEVSAEDERDRDAAERTEAVGDTEAENQMKLGASSCKDEPTRVGTSENEAKKRGLSEDVRKVLRRFPEDQFVIAKQFCALEEAFDQGGGLLDLFSGQRGFSKSFTKKGGPWSLCFDIKHSPEEDLLVPRLQKDLLTLLNSGAFVAMAASPVCASFSTAITPPWRTLEYPRGRPGLREDQMLKIQLGHDQLALVLRLVACCITNGLLFWVENPDGSWFWRLDDDLSWGDIDKHEAVGNFRVDQCRFSTAWRKRTRFKTNCHLRHQKVLCKCLGPHLKLRGKCKESGMNYTKLAESYPRSLCEIIAAAFARDLNLGAKTRKISVSDCVFSKGKRIGEALHPGPRRPRQPREGTLDDFELLEPQTIALRGRIWADFKIWLDQEVGENALDSSLSSPLLFIKILEAYGKVKFSAGMPLHYYRQLLAHCQREFPLMKPFMTPAWLLVSKWEAAEPTQHRPPIPEPIVVAIAVLSFFWKWPRFTSTILMSFFGICRIGEVLAACRRDLLTPTDLLDPKEKIYLRIVSPKTRNRGPRVQYCTFENQQLVPLVLAAWEHLQPGEKLFPHSAGTFRRRWDALMAPLGVEKFHKMTPGSLRGGGSVAAHKRGLGIQEICWCMRLQHVKTLGYYLQEVTAVSILPQLKPNSRESILALQGLLPYLLEAILSAQDT